MSSQVVLRPLAASDLDHVRRTVYTAVDWNPERELPPFDLVIDHPELVRYHRDWGRPGDAGVAAEVDGEVVGVAFYRLFTEEDHGHGYLEPQTPEVTIAVADSHRGQGIGAQLLDRLADTARAEGITQLSLSVDADNRARQLYERAGYREISRDEGGIRMLRAL